RGDGFDDRLVGAENRHEIAVSKDLDRPFRAAPQRRLVEACDHRTAARLAHDAGMHHAVENHVVSESGSAEHLGGEINTRRVSPDDVIVAHAPGSRLTGGIAPEIDGGGERPVVVAGRLAAVDYR